MADQTETKLYEVPPQGGLGFGVYTAEVTAADTVTLSKYDVIIKAVAVKLEDNSDIAITYVGNVITIPAGPDSDKILIMALGV